MLIVYFYKWAVPCKSTLKPITPIMPGSSYPETPFFFLFLKKRGRRKTIKGTALSVGGGCSLSHQSTPKQLVLKTLGKA